MLYYLRKAGYNVLSPDRGKCSRSSARLPKRSLGNCISAWLGGLCDHLGWLLCTVCNKKLGCWRSTSPGPMSNKDFQLGKASCQKQRCWIKDSSRYSLFSKLHASGGVGLSLSHFHIYELPLSRGYGDSSMGVLAKWASAKAGVMTSREHFHPSPWDSQEYKGPKQSSNLWSAGQAKDFNRKG